MRVKRLDAHALRAKLAARAHLVASARDLANQLRGLLRVFGLIVGKSKGQAFERRALELVAGCPALQPVAAALAPSADVGSARSAKLLAARRAVLAEVERLDRALAGRIGMKKARVALARKLAVLLHHLWSHQEDFRWAPD